MLLYAFNDEDEVSAAQVLNNFSKKNTTLKFVGGISSTGEFINSDSVKALASLPNKNQLISGLVYTLNGPINNITSTLSGNLHGLLDGIANKSK
jgi:large subunit ribosomal protein L10